jgi:hypothetical protein
MTVFRFLLSPIATRQGKGVSLTRLLALLFGVTGCVVALRAPSEAATVAALVSGGAVALVARERGATNA